MGTEGMAGGNEAEKMNCEEGTPLRAGKELLNKGFRSIDAALLEALERLEKTVDSDVVVEDAAGA